MADDKPSLIAFAGDSDPVGDERTVVANLDSLKREATAERNKHETGWLQNAAFFAGNQSEAFSEDVRKYAKRHVEFASTGKLKRVYNHIYRLTLQRMAYLVGNFPQNVAVAATPDPVDVQAAETATDLIEVYRYAHNEDERRLFDLLWLAQSADLIRYQYWDPDATYDGFSGQLVGGGDVASVTFPWHRVLLSPHNDSTESLSWVMLTEAMDVDDINDAWKGHEVKEEEVAQSMRGFDRLLTSVVVQSIGSTTKKKGAAIVTWMFSTPSRRHPKGALFIWAHGKLLQHGDLPDGFFGIQRLSWTPIPGSVYSKAFIQPLIDPQIEYNNARNRQGDVVNRQLRGDIMTTGNGVVTQKKQVDEDGKPTDAKVIQAGAGVTHAEFLRYDLNVADSREHCIMLVNEMMDFTQQHDPSLGKQTTGDQRVGTTLALMQADQTGASLHRDRLAAAYCKVDQMKMRILKEHVKLPRLYSLVGSGGEAANPIAFVGSDLRATSDVRVRPTPMMSELERRQRFVAYKESQLFTARSPDPRMRQIDLLADAEFVLREGLPGAEQFVEQNLGGITVEELRQVVAEIRHIDMQTALLVAEGAAQEAAMMAAGAGQPQPGQPGQGQPTPGMVPPGG